MELSLRDALSVLSKASPFSVKTINEKPYDKLDEAKDWLYVEQDIERDFRRTLKSLSGNELVFLCGSSGDGKSEILARCQQQYRNKFRFHLDGTHSFKPDQSAIQALDQLFDESEADERPLIIGINIGMLANYSKEGAGRHNRIKEQIEQFLKGEPVADNYRFLNFEDYPKFQLNSSSDTSHSKFAKQLMQKLTYPSEANPFYVLYQQDKEKGIDRSLLINFGLLALNEVQNAIIINLFKVRLVKDKFITARALLDFIHHLLLGKDYLADNLFGGSDNELVQRMKDFDPAMLHTYKLDQFVLRYNLKLPIPELSSFLLTLQEEGIIGDFNESIRENAATLVRMFYLLRHSSIGNDFHLQFKGDFKESLLDDYAHVWTLHASYDESSEMKNELRWFYNQQLISAIYRYANRNAPWLQKGEIFLGHVGALQLAVPVDIKVDFNEIKKNKSKTVSRFWACLRVADEALMPVAINLNFFELIFKLNCGYRPNKYDKNAIVLLDELVEQVSDVAKNSDALRFYDNGHCYIAQLDDGMIEVSGVN